MTALRTFTKLSLALMLLAGTAAIGPASASCFLHDMMASSTPKVTKAKAKPRAMSLKSTKKTRMAKAKKPAQRKTCGDDCVVSTGSPGGATSGSAGGWQ